jgi:hypothetical protein
MKSLSGSEDYRHGIFDLGGVGSLQGYAYRKEIGSAGDAHDDFRLCGFRLWTECLKLKTIIFPDIGKMYTRPSQMEPLL